MSNPYLQAAEEITGQDLRNPQPIPRIVPQKKPQLQPLPRRLPQIAPISPVSPFGELSKFSKLRKMVFLMAVGAVFAAGKFFTSRYEVQLLAESPENRDLKQLLPKINKILLPATALFAFPVVLALLSDKEYPFLAWISWLAAIAYSLKETGPGVISLIRDTKGSADEFAEKGIVAARRRARKK
jgi:hypothetical protein